MSTKSMVTTNTTHKKRGRPPKTDLKPKTIIFEQPKETEELVLYLPLTDKQDSNAYSINDSQINDSQINDSQINDSQFNDSQDNTNLITAIPSNEHSYLVTNIDTELNIVNSSDNSSDINKLINEIKKRDIIIKNLKDNLKNFKTYHQDNILNVHKDIKKTLINLGLISINDNKLIVANTSKYACWWCCYNFDTYPIFLPDKYVNKKYYVFGNFCSFGCVLAYNDNLNDYRKNIREGLIKKMYKDIFNIDCEIKSAGPKELLEKFGGPINIDNYRDSKTVCSKNLNINIPPQIPLLSYFEEVNINKS